jgi:hypothetical protein
LDFTYGLKLEIWSFIMEGNIFLSCDPQDSVRIIIPH